MTPAERAEFRDLVREVVEEVVGEQLLSSKGLMSDEEIATHLGIPTRRWRKMYEEYQPLSAIRYGMGSRGGGTEGRWELAEVLRVLRARTRRRRSWDGD